MGQTDTTRADTVTGREQKLRDERDRLYRAAWIVLRRSGYVNANITDILGEAKLGTRAFYRQFESKDDLLIAMFRANAAVTAERVAERVAAAGGPLERVLAWIDQLLDLAHDPRHREIARMFTATPIRAVIAEAGDETLAQLREPLLAALVDGLASGEFPDCDPGADATTIHAIVWQLFDDAIQRSPALDRDAARAHVERFVLPALGAGATP